MPILHGDRHARTAMKPGNTGVLDQLGKLGFRQLSLINLFSGVSSHASEHSTSQRPNLNQFLATRDFYFAEKIAGELRLAVKRLNAEIAKKQTAAEEE
jgi:hypothetical protein